LGTFLDNKVLKKLKFSKNQNRTRQGNLVDFLGQGSEAKVGHPIFSGIFAIFFRGFFTFSLFYTVAV
jgi:hypothetical protein